MEGVFVKEFSGNKNDKAGVSISKRVLAVETKKTRRDGEKESYYRENVGGGCRTLSPKTGNFLFTAGSTSAWKWNSEALGARSCHPKRRPRVPLGALAQTRRTSGFCTAVDLRP